MDECVHIHEIVTTYNTQASRAQIFVLRDLTGDKHVSNTPLCKNNQCDNDR